MADTTKKRLTDIAVAHYAARLRGEKSKIEVPEWGITIYWHPWTLFEKDSCFPPGGIFRPRVIADVIIAKAVDIDGKPLADEADRREIMGEWDPVIAERVARRIMDDATIEGSEAGMEAARKNSETTATSSSPSASPSS